MAYSAEKTAITAANNLIAVNFDMGLQKEVKCTIIYHQQSMQVVKLVYPTQPFDLLDRSVRKRPDDAVSDTSHMMKLPQRAPPRLFPNPPERHTQLLQRTQKMLAATTLPTEVDATKEVEKFRNYVDSDRQDIVVNHYKLMRTNQTLEFVDKMIAKYTFDKPRQHMTIQEAFRKLENYVDSSDPDVR
jgi:hypothetical protein